MHSPIADDLQDLSPEDAQELRAFLDKRRWFEGKLKVLEALPPIYPFVHPNLEQPALSSTTSSSEPVYIDHNRTEWRLPSEEDVRRGQRERDALEEEILAFDGGDLMRMKQKTRAATLLPLTPPSTHLVSITLALIVVIDRLLTLLRHRGELLELTSMRLQWDALRWQILQETTRIRTEIDDIARGKGRWIPPAQVRKFQRPSDGGVRTPTGSPLPRAATLASTPSASSLSNVVTSPLKQPQLAVGMPDIKRDSSTSLASLASNNTPKRSLHLPLLRSSIANLEIRQRNLASTSVSRSGKLLDRMIDVAIPLKDLGGVDGPGGDGEGGAVPDELLDIQDAIENELSELETRTNWCRGLEQQWDAADKHYLASLQAQEMAEAVLDDLFDAFPQAPTGQHYQKLSERLSSAREALPAEINPSFPAPSHPSYPEYSEHTSLLLDQLKQARTEAQFRVSTCDEALAWYGKLVAASEGLAISRTAAISSLEDVRAAVSNLDNGEDGLSRPKLDGISTIQTHAAVAQWLRVLPGRIEASRTVKEKSSEHAQRLAVATMRYRQIVRAPPKVIREQVGAGAYLDIVDKADQLADNCQNELARLTSVMSETDRDGIVLTAVQSVSTLAQELRSRASALAENLNGLEDHSEGALLPLQAAIAELQATRPAFVAMSDNVHAVLRSQDRSIPPLSDYIASLAKTVCSDLDDISDQVELAAAISKQTATVSAIEAEAGEMVQRMEHMIVASQTSRDDAFGRSGTSKGGVDDISDTAHALQTEVETWTNGLTSRIRFISANSYLNGDPLRDNAGLRHRPLLAATTSSSAPPMTPPGSPSRGIVTPAPPEAAMSRNPAQCDHRARMRVNETSSRVNGCLATLLHEIAALSEERETQSSDVFGTIATVPSSADSAVGSEPATTVTLLRRLEDLHLETLLSPSPSALQQTPSSRHIPSSPKARHIREELKAIRADYENLRSRSGSTGAKDLTAVDTALCTAESGLSKLDQLAAVSQAVKACDEAFSRLLDALDELTDRDVILAKKQRAEADIDHLRSTASVAMDDARVVAEVKRTETSWQELETLAAETMSSVETPARDRDAASDTASIVSTSSQTYRQPLSRPNARIASNPIQQPPRGLPEPRNRAASDTPSQIRFDSFRSGLPRLQKASTGQPTGVISPVTTTGRARPSTPSSIPRPTRLSNASSAAHTTPTAGTSTTPRVRKTSRLSAASVGPSSTPRPRKTYVADPKSKLDVAVGRIVNKLEVNVPIRPVGADAADEWKDQSGKYWIGAEGRAKLCFCRILRSKTVMVRVGGGWVELSKFLQDHFADSFTDWDPSSSGRQACIGAMGIGSSTPVPITSASLSTPLRPKTSVEAPTTAHGADTPRQPSDVGLTPGRHPALPRSASDKNLSTPQRYPANPAASPQSASKHAANGPGTPLVPLHFIRKAGESPEVRQMEREKLVTGKRSILGRSHSGNVSSVSPEKDVGASPGR